MSYTYNRFEDRSVFGAFNNIYLDASHNAIATFQRNVNVGGDISCNNVMCDDIQLNDMFIDGKLQHQILWNLFSVTSSNLIQI